MSENYLYPTHEAGKHLFSKNIEGAVVNLNLIRLKEYADYSAFPDLKPEGKMTGLDAFMKYVEAAAPHVKHSGGDILFIGKGDRFLIGPETEYWDLCMLIRQKSIQDFFGFEKNEAYMKAHAHRMAAVEDSRLLPLEEILNHLKPD